jgi:hypothetical protein
VVLRSVEDGAEAIGSAPPLVLGFYSPNIFRNANL